ncbi:hypothetical protein J6590_009132 [Homalodisca vitripennis]|nr:hypothetical protein J6590_009132 [Homalodisca vitripennis]
MTRGNEDDRESERGQETAVAGTRLQRRHGVDSVSDVIMVLRRAASGNTEPHVAGARGPSPLKRDRGHGISPSANTIQD